MITTEQLLAAGWKKMGNAWYGTGKTLTNYDGAWQLWKNGVTTIVKTMEEI